MSGDQRGRVGETELIAELREILDETQRTIDASQIILDRCAAGPAALSDPAGPAPLDEIADGLMHAYRFARQDGDPATVALVEQALLHVGHRLAQGLTVEEAGLVRH